MAKKDKDFQPVENEKVIRTSNNSYYRVHSIENKGGVPAAPIYNLIPQARRRIGLPVSDVPFALPVPVTQQTMNEFFEKGKDNSGVIKSDVPVATPGPKSTDSDS